ncbi:putative bifunctional diguanylate cyclase/phosphodiesterase [Consotaella salsifontis]|uniref:Diguanylate cyclase (GGDEF) domain-containing protein n=1 Tax=Consotaella salsifontis TaxID=1365950 RepID=A0A1T4LAR1_9HYPH|nr:EAL domain-containing protein [Consotaella salsifontis]SJZ51720.1 diguanylate cyclase (GGDEF) domain-containing protein [Consotaella salsifontis]
MNQLTGRRPFQFRAFRRRAGGSKALVDAERRSHPLLLIFLPVFLILGLTALFVGGVAYWSASKIEGDTRQREEQSVAESVANLSLQIVGRQAAFVQLDQMIRAQGFSAIQGFGSNIESWTSRILSIDRSAILSESGERLFAMSQSQRVDPTGFLPEIGDLLNRFQDRQSAVTAQPTAGVALYNFLLIDGRPALAYVTQSIGKGSSGYDDLGQRMLHVAVTFLDGSFLEHFRQSLQLANPHFSSTPSEDPAEACYSLTSPDGPVSYLCWTVDRPNLVVLRELAPALVVGLTVVLLLIGTLIYWLYRTSSRLMSTQKRVHHLAFHDSLTGLANRARFAERLDIHLERARRSNASFAVLFLDLDRFKHVNDTFGHQAGDELIRQVADRLRKITRQGDTVARLGGDEFAIVTSMCQPGDIEALSRRIVLVISAPFDLGGVQAFVGVSVGAVIAVPTTEDQEELIHRADIALYQSKSRGRSNFTIFSDTLVEAEKNKRQMEVDLRHALWAPNQLQVHYQPLLDAQTGTLTGLEALLRWNHPRLGLIGPLEFLPVAEESGLILPLGDWVLRMACQVAAEFPNLTMAVNLSPAQVKDPRLVERVLSIVEETDVSPTRIQLEIPESTLLDTPQGVLETLAKLRASSIHVVIDDFGSGDSSIGYLKRCKIDGLKVDQAFIRELGETGGTAATVVNAIANLAHAMGLAVTAEGVETDEQMECAIAAGCHVVQGNLFSQAMPIEQLRRMVPQHAEKSYGRPSAKTQVADRTLPAATA